MEPIRGLEIVVPCGHFYDKKCTLELFSAATLDESLYPPRCCRHRILPTSVFPYMSQEARQAFEEKGREFSTLKRVYCASETCSRFLGPQSEGDTSPSWMPPLLTCTSPGCQTITCGGCKSLTKGGTVHRCSGADTDDQLILELGDRQGWARCPGCGQLIELDLGCFHMTCRCKTEFCYVCKEHWKNCACPQWDEQRLLAAAEQRVDDQLRREEGQNGDIAAGVVPAAAPVEALVAPPAVAPVAPPVALEPRAAPASAAAVPTGAPWRQTLIQRWMDHLRDNHECRHENWRYRPGGGVCRTCYDTLPLHLYVSVPVHRSLATSSTDSVYAAVHRLRDIGL